MLKHKAAIITVVLLTFVFSIGIFAKLGFSLLPSTSSPQFQIEFSLKPGTSTNKTAQVAKEIENYLIEHKDKYNIEYVYTSYGSDENNAFQGFMGNVGKESGFVGCGLNENEDLIPFDKIKKEIEKEFFTKLKEKYPDISVEFINPMAQQTQFFGKPVEVEIKGNDDETLKEISNKVVERISKFDFVKNLTSSLSNKIEKLVVKPDNDKLEAKNSVLFK